MGRGGPTYFNWGGRGVSWLIFYFKMASYIWLGVGGGHIFQFGGWEGETYFNLGEGLKKVRVCDPLPIAFFWNSLKINLKIWLGNFQLQFMYKSHKDSSNINEQVITDCKNSRILLTKTCLIVKTYSNHPEVLGHQGCVLSVVAPGECCLLWAPSSVQHYTILSGCSCIL